MKTEINSLIVGDIFAEKIQLRGRIAFEVLEIEDEAIRVINRSNNSVSKKQKKGYVIWLRNKCETI